MNTKVTLSEKEWYTPEQAAKYLSLSPHSLQKWRQLKKGPRYSKFGNIVRYNITDLRSFYEQYWVERKEVTSG